MQHEAPSTDPSYRLVPDNVASDVISALSTDPDAQDDFRFFTTNDEGERWRFALRSEVGRVAYESCFPIVIVAGDLRSDGSICRHRKLVILPLSRLFVDPRLRAAFARAEDEGSSPPLWLHQ
jgi:hypothetical protein